MFLPLKEGNVKCTKNRKRFLAFAFILLYNIYKIVKEKIRRMP